MPTCKPIPGGRHGGNEADKQRWDLFIAAYLKNGHSSIDAAIAAGYKSTSRQRLVAVASRIRNYPYVVAQLAKVAKEQAEITGLDISRTLREIARIAYSDVADMFDADGRLLSLRDMKPQARAAISTIEIEEVLEGDEKNPVRIVTKKIKLWDKNAALDKAMKHLGLYLRDNEQRQDVIQALIVTANQTLDAKLQRLISNTVVGPKEEPDAGRSISPPV